MDPTKPPLTAAMVEVDKAAGSSPPGAGGWTPTPRTLFLLSAAPAALGGLAVSVGAAGAGTPYQFPCLIAAAVLAAGALYCSTLIGGKSAGPRSAQ